MIFLKLKQRQNKIFCPSFQLILKYSKVINVIFIILKALQGLALAFPSFCSTHTNTDPVANLY